MRRATLILGVVLLIAGISQADVLVDLGTRVASVNPETDGQYWNSIGYDYEDAGWGPARDHYESGLGWVSEDPLFDSTGAATAITVETSDISGYGGNNAPDVAPYPHNATVDWWNGQGSNDANPAGIRLTNVPAGTYDLVVTAWYPSDPWVEGAGTYTCQGTSFTYNSWDQTPAPVDVYTFSDVTPDGSGNIELWITSIFPGESGKATYNGISTLQLVPEPATLSLLAIGGLLAIRRRR